MGVGSKIGIPEMGRPGRWTTDRAISRFHMSSLRTLLSNREGWAAGVVWRAPHQSQPSNMLSKERQESRS